MRDGLSLLDQVIAACGGHLEEKRVRQVLGVVPAELLADIMRAVDAADSRRVLEQVGQLASEGYELAHFCGELTRFVRDLMIGRSCGAESTLIQVPTDQRKHIGELAGRFSEEDLSRFFNILLRAESEMRYALVPRFHLELALMKMVHARRLASLEMLLSGLGGASPAGQEPLLPCAPPRFRPRVPLRNHRARFAPAEFRKTAGGATLARACDLSARPGDGITAPACAGGNCRALRTMTPSWPPSNPRSTANRIFWAVAWSTCPVGDSRMVKPHLFMRQKDSFFADLLKSREQQETLRAVCAEVLGQPVKICVRLEME